MQQNMLSDSIMHVLRLCPVLLIAWVIAAAASAEVCPQLSTQGFFVEKREVQCLKMSKLYLENGKAIQEESNRALILESMDEMDFNRHSKSGCAGKQSLVFTCMALVERTLFGCLLGQQDLGAMLL